MASLNIRMYCSLPDWLNTMTLSLGQSRGEPNGARKLVRSSVHSSANFSMDIPLPFFLNSLEEDRDQRIELCYEQPRLVSHTGLRAKTKTMNGKLPADHGQKRDDMKKCKSSLSSTVTTARHE